MWGERRGMLEGLGCPRSVRRRLELARSRLHWCAGARVADEQRAAELERATAEARCCNARAEAEAKLSAHVEELKKSLQAQLEAAQAAAQSERAGLEQ